MAAMPVERPRPRIPPVWEPLKRRPRAALAAEAGTVARSMLQLGARPAERAPMAAKEAVRWLLQRQETVRRPEPMPSVATAATPESARSTKTTSQKPGTARRVPEASREQPQEAPTTLAIPLQRPMLPAVTGA